METLKINNWMPVDSAPTSPETIEGEDETNTTVANNNLENLSLSLPSSLSFGVSGTNNGSYLDGVPDGIEKDDDIVEDINSVDAESDSGRDSLLETPRTRSLKMDGVKIVVGKNLSSRRFVRISDGDIQQEVHLHNESQTDKLIFFDLATLSQPPDSSIRYDLNVKDFQNVRHLCNGSHSHVYKADLAGAGAILAKSSSSNNINVDRPSSPLSPSISTANSFKTKTPDIPVVDNTVVLKVLIEDSVHNNIACKEFAREVLILSKMNHAHILKLLGSGQLPSKVHDGLFRPLIVLEALNGDTLTYHLSLKRSFHTRPFTELRYLRMAKEFASALYYIHDQLDENCTLIHRDLKPDNIGFTLNGQLKLLDFGLCISIKKNASDNGFYQLTGCTGSLRYMAPEVALNKPYNEKVDIYGFGLIFYEMITGVTPFTGMDKNMLYTRVINQNYRPDLVYDDYGREVKISIELKDFIAHCWDVNPSNRPSAKSSYEYLKKLEETKGLKSNRRNFIRKSIDQVFHKKDSI